MKSAGTRRSYGIASLPCGRRTKYNLIIPLVLLVVLVILTEIGFTVAIGVLLDTIIVRSVLVTALTLDIGRWVWWPSGLARQPAGDDHITPVSATALR